MTSGVYKRTPRPLTHKQRKLVDEYFVDFNKSAAARRAGYSVSSVEEPKHRGKGFEHPAVKKEIERRQAKVQAKYDLNEDWVIQRLMRIADAGAILAKFKKVEPDGTLSWNFKGATQEELAVINDLSVETYVEGRGDGAREVKKFKIGVSDVKGALDSLCRRLGLFQDKMQLSGDAALVERLQNARTRSAPPKK